MRLKAFETIVLNNSDETRRVKAKYFEDLSTLNPLLSNGGHRAKSVGGQTLRMIVQHQKLKYTTL